MGIERALKTPGWMSENELSYIADLASRHSCIVEVGSWRGRSAVAWAQNTSGVVYCIDVWANDAYGISFPEDPPDLHQREEWLLTEFHKNIIGILNIVPIRTYSVKGAGIIKAMGLRPDVIFLDADHSYPSVMGDMDAWTPLLADGGVLCGHDYGYGGWPDVKTVVDARVPKFRLIDTLWTTEL
jgi:hypothetical protein